MDKHGNLDMKKMKVGGHAATFLSVTRYVVMLALYGGFTTVIVGVFAMQGPKEIWGDAVPPVSPAVMSTIILTAIFFTVHLLVALCKTVEELKGELPPMLTTVRENLEVAEYTVDFAPTLCMECKVCEGEFEGDVVVEVSNLLLAKAVTAVR